jgi:ubiquinone biosynthesis protein
MLFAFIIESFVKKTKRLKLVEVVFLLKEITNLEMDLRFEAAAANEYAENTKMMLDSSSSNLLEFYK